MLCRDNQPEVKVLNQEHLTLRLTRLSAGQTWSHSPGMSFLFPKGGGGTAAGVRFTQRLGPGDVVVFSGEEPGRVCVPERGELVFWGFSLKLEHLFPLFACEEIALLQAVTERLKGVRLYAAASPLARECHRLIGELPPQFNLDHRSQLLRVATTILSEEFKDARPHRSGYVRIEEHLVQAFEKLTTEELLSLSVSELAQHFGCSRRHLNRLFRHHFGFSVVGLRMEMRLLKAVSLLRDPDAKIIHVAEQSGFNHLGLFNTCFRKRFGTSPGQWRKLSAEGIVHAADVVGTGMFCPLHSNGFCPWLGESRNGRPTLPRTNGVAKPPERKPDLLPARKAPERGEGAGAAAKSGRELEAAGAGESAAAFRFGQSSRL